jgi:citrate synthase
MTSNTDIKRGLEGVVVDTTSISLVDGEAGVLSYRGVPIDDLVDAPFGEVAALVVDDERSDSLAREIAPHAELSDRERHLVLSLPEDAHPMNLKDGQTVKVATEAGEVEIELNVTEQTKPGFVTMPHGFGLEYKGSAYGANVNRLTKNTHRDQLAGTPLHRYVRCKVEAAS